MKHIKIFESDLTSQKDYKQQRLFEVEKSKNLKSLITGYYLNLGKISTIYGHIKTDDPNLDQVLVKSVEGFSWISVKPNQVYDQVRNLEESKELYRRLISTNESFTGDNDNDDEIRVNQKIYKQQRLVEVENSTDLESLVIGYYLDLAKASFNLEIPIFGHIKTDNPSLDCVLVKAVGGFAWINVRPNLIYNQAKNLNRAKELYRRLSKINESASEDINEIDANKIYNQVKYLIQGIDIKILRPFINEHGYKVDIDYLKTKSGMAEILISQLIINHKITIEDLKNFLNK